MADFNVENFKSDIDHAPWGSLDVFDDGDLDNKVTVLENIYKDIIDKHCPKVEIRVTHPSSTAWRTPEIKELQNDRDCYYSKLKKMKKNSKTFMKNDPNFIAKIKITENIYHHFRNKVTNEIRKSKKLKQPKEFHKALK